MPLRTDVEKAFEELIGDEAGTKFQGLAVVLAKQKWRRLIASERHRDLGLDAHASGDLEPDGKGMGLACSLTAEYEKIADDVLGKSVIAALRCLQSQPSTTWYET